MKHSPRNFLLLLFYSAALVSLAAGRVDAGDYYVYRDANGNLVLSNSRPAPGRNVIKKETLPEVTDQEIAEARAYDEALRADNRLTSLERTVDELSESLRARNSAAETSRQAAGDGGVIVGVTNGFIRRPPQRPTKRAPNSKAPSQPSLLPGGSLPPGSLPGGSLPAGSLPGGKMG